MIKKVDWVGVLKKGLAVVQISGTIAGIVIGVMDVGDKIGELKDLKTQKKDIEDSVAPTVEGTVEA